MPDKIIAIGNWENNKSRSLRLQKFMIEDKSFIPIFSDEMTFSHQIRGSGFESSGVAVDRNFLLSILRGDELLILNPGGSDPLKLTKADLVSGRAAVWK